MLYQSSWSWITGTMRTGAFFLQEDDYGVEHRVCFVSHKSDQHQFRYFTIEKESLVLPLAMQHFEGYVEDSVHSVFSPSRISQAFIGLLWPKMPDFIATFYKIAMHDAIFLGLFLQLNWGNKWKLQKYLLFLYNPLKIESNLFQWE